ncbi:Uncharacterised protein [Amycolatopsis camponoti]|uniref:Uncharacterized protein n=1 Tax=Amycolatopsis camponoti TaxID=2606593 RepID=A0A6I8LPC0_9PSEU|nr:Uncharacterised protein [Amycolatopsis camponoti]
MPHRGRRGHHRPMISYRTPLLPTVAATTAPVQQQPCRPRRSITPAP